MRKIKLFWHIYPAFLIITLISLGVVAWFSTYSTWRFYLNQVKEQLEAQAHLIEERLNLEGPAALHRGLQPTCRNLGGLSSSRITLIAKGGRVICDSERPPQSMDNHSDRPEIIDARINGKGSSVRRSHTLNTDMMYVALPFKDTRHSGNIIRVSVPIPSLKKIFLESIQQQLLLSILLISGFVAVASWFLSRRIALPLEQMKKNAENFARGNLRNKLPIIGSSEISALAATMNKMAADLARRLRTIREQRSQLDAVFTSMDEAVVAVDSDDNVLTFNPSAARLLNITLENALGKNILEIIRSSRLHAMFEHILSFSETIEEDFTLEDGKSRRFFHIKGSGLINEAGNKIGALIVMNDITNLKRLESLRKEFVANVSHELKTPITSIKGAVETLESGAMDNRDEAQRFLRMIDKNSERLHRIVEDLLSLSRIEQSTEGSTVSLEPASLNKVMIEAIHACEAKAAVKSITLDFRADREITGTVNASLLEEAVFNLLDNAIKYSGKNTNVTVNLKDHGGELLISVMDSGPGISEEHLPRLFERFYRVDKARSRNLGGTGLGLAIVKHIVQVHKGTVTVKSELGKGSMFTLRIPNKTQA